MVTIKPRPKGDHTLNKALAKSRRISGPATAKLTADLLRKMDAWWRAANYLSVGQTYLYDTPLLKKPLKKEHVKPRLVGQRRSSLRKCVFT